jgi:hypothetical protein
MRGPDAMQRVPVLSSGHCTTDLLTHPLTFVTAAETVNVAAFVPPLYVPP